MSAAPIRHPAIDAALRAVEAARDAYDALPADAPDRLRDAAIFDLCAAELRRDAVLAEARGRVIA